MFGGSRAGGDPPPPVPPARATLITRLAGYPPNTPPFIGPSRTRPNTVHPRLTDKQLDANLAHLLAQRDARLTAITGLLSADGIAVAPLLDPAQDPLPVARAIDDWLTALAPPLADLPGANPANAPDDLFLDSNRAGAHVLFSLIADLGLIEGEAIARRRPDFAWAIDRNPASRAMPHYRRPCLIKPPLPHWGASTFDLEVMMLSVVYERSRGQGVLHRFGDVIDAVLRGACDPAPDGRY